jgi:hypothetical protein
VRDAREALLLSLNNVFEHHPNVPPLSAQEIEAMMDLAQELVAKYHPIWEGIKDVNHSSQLPTIDGIIAYKDHKHMKKIKSRSYCMFLDGNEDPPDVPVSLIIIPSSENFNQDVLRQVTGSRLHSRV